MRRAGTLKDASMDVIVLLQYGFDQMPGARTARAHIARQDGTKHQTPADTEDCHRSRQAGQQHMRIHAGRKMKNKR